MAGRSERDPLARDPEPVVHSALEDIDRLIADVYLRYRGALAVSAALRSLAHPESIESNRANLAVLIAEAASWAVLTGRVARRKRLDDTAIIFEALNSVALSSIGFRSLSAEEWGRGKAWTTGSALWRAAGVGMFERRPGRSAMLLAVQCLPYLVDGRRAEVVSRADSMGVLCMLVTFWTAGRQLSAGLRRRATQIDETVGMAATAQFDQAVASEQATLREAVLKRTANVLAEIEAELAQDRDRATRLAVEEERRLRRWLNQDVELVAEMRHEIEQPTTESAGEGGLLVFVKRLEAAFRTVSTSIMVAQLIADRRAWTTRGLGPMTAIAATLHSSVISAALLRRGAKLRRERIAAADIAMSILTSAAEQRELRRGHRCGYLVAYAITLGPSAGSLDVQNRRASIPMIIGAVRAIAALDEVGDWWRRCAAGLDEFLLISVSWWVSQWCARAALDQTILLSRRLSELANRRSGARLEAVRLRDRAFVHDGAVQVLMWVGKDDLDVDQLRRWIRDERLKVEAAAAGATDDIDSAVSDALDDLFSGFRRIGMSISADLEAPSLPPEHARVLIDIANESITNIFKHTPTRSAEVRLCRHGSDLLLTIEDEGGSGEARPGSGVGTRTMSARARQIGADLSWSSTERGTKVSLRIPAVERSGGH